MSEEKMCACGRPLHYDDPALRELLEEIIKDKGETAKITVGGRSWLFQRHYLALHGLKAWEAAEVAQRLGFPEVTGK